MAVLALCLLAVAVPAASASARYEIAVDLTNQMVTVYDAGNTADSGIVRQMICSTGKGAKATPSGTFYLPAKTYAAERQEWYYFPVYKCYAKWATRIRGGILFHSVLYNAAKRGPTSSSVNALGSKASHGCVRLKVADAKWIAQNCPAGTKCRIFSSGKRNNTLRTKLKKKTFSRDEQTYASYIAPPESKLPLKLNSTGTLVTKLQARLRALGFLNAQPDGKFGKVTLKAVQSFQSAAKLKKTNKVDQKLWDRIFSDAAPTGTAVTLSPGSEGPAVAALQRALVTLKLLNGGADGSYGSKTAEAVRRYQQVFGGAANGVANTATQKAVFAKADSVQRQFGDGEYELATVTVEVSMARVTARSGLKLRKTASASGKVLATLKRGATAQVLSRGNTWSKSLYGGKKGYLKNSYLEFYTEEQTVTDYFAPAVEPTPTPGPTPTPEIWLPACIPPQNGEEPCEPSEPPQGEPSEQPEVELPQGESEAALYALVVRDGAALYDAPDDAANAAGTAEACTAYVCAGVQGDWVRVLCEGAERYLRLADVTLTDDPFAPTAADGAEAVEAAPDDGPGLTVETEDASRPPEADGQAPEAEGETGLTVETEATPEPATEIIPVDVGDDAG